MATAIDPRLKIQQDEGLQRFILHLVGWTEYEAIGDALLDRPMRATYDRGTLEFMTLSDTHEWLKRVFGRLVETLTEELNIPIKSGGSTTFKRQLKQRGLEPDECYYVQNEHQVRGRTIDLATDPFPDLVIEIEVSCSALDRMGIYAALGFPEIWRFDGQTLWVHRLQPDGTYAESARSACFPFLPMDRVLEFLLRVNETDETTWIRTFRAWVRAEVAPLYQRVEGNA